MLPCPPFDGSRLYLVFLPEKAYFGIMRYERYMMGAVFILLWLGVLDTPLRFLYMNAMVLLDRATGVLGHLFAAAG